MKSIRLSDPTYARLLDRAESFDDDAETVIVRLLDESESSPPKSDGPVPTGRRGRAAPGSILPEREYWPAILRVLVDHGGRAPANDVIDDVGVMLKDALLKSDFDELEIGEVRWRNRVRFARLRMKEKGLLRADSPRGVWEVSDQGREYLRRGRDA